MTVPEHFLAVLGVVLFFGLLLPQLLRPFHLPFATSLIIVGSVLGPYGIGYVENDDNLVMFAFLGAMFQMLLAGSEARTMDIRLRERATIRLALFNGALPAAIGVAIARAFDYGWTTSLFVGIVFMSSSIMLLFGMVRTLGMDATPAGRLLKGVAVIEDLGAAVLAFVLFQMLEPHHRFPLPILAGLLLSSVLLLRMFLPEIVSFLFRRLERDEAGHEAQLRIVVALMLLLIFGYSTLDVHPVIAAFIVGFALAGVPESPSLRGRLESLGYGLFIPVFLFSVGLDTDLSVLWRFELSNPIALAIVVGAGGSKLVGGFIGARWAGLASRDAAIVGVASMAKLALPLSATYAAKDLGLIDAELFSAIVIVSVLTSVLMPILLGPLRRKESAEAPAAGTGTGGGKA